MWQGGALSAPFHRRFSSLQRDAGFQFAEAELCLAHPVQTLQWSTLGRWPRRGLEVFEYSEASLVPFAHRTSFRFVSG